MKIRQQQLQSQLPTLISRSLFRSSLTLLSYGLKRKWVTRYKAILDVSEMAGFQVTRQLYRSKWKSNPSSAQPSIRHFWQPRCFVLILSSHVADITTHSNGGKERWTSPFISEKQKQKKPL